MSQKAASETPKMTADPRQFPRIATTSLVTWRLLDDTEDHLPERGPAAGMVQNISGGGACIALPSDPGTGRLLALEIRPPGIPTSILALGEVRWSRPNRSAGFDVGVEFWWVGWRDSGAQEEIRRFLSSRLLTVPAQR